MNWYDFDKYVCRVCGTTYDNSFNVKGPCATCTNCGNLLSGPGTCVCCGVSSKVNARCLCNKCSNKFRSYKGRDIDKDQNRRLSNATIEKNRVRMKTRLDTLVKKLSSSNLPPLSNKEWIETCRYFNGCAICGTPHIDARTYIVPVKKGGKYIAANVIPTCKDCCNTHSFKDNIYLFLEPSNMFASNSRVSEETRNRYKKIIEFIETKLDQAISEEKSSDE